MPMGGSFFQASLMHHPYLARGKLSSRVLGSSGLDAPQLTSLPRPFCADRARYAPGGAMVPATRFAIRFEPAYAVLSRMLLIPPANSTIEITDAKVSARMGWAFHATFARSAVRRTSLLGKRVPLTRGVHGWAGRWLVNGAGDGILVIHLDPPQRACVMGFPVKLRELLVSVDEPSALATALTNGAPS